MKALERYRAFLPFASLSLIGATALVFGTRWGAGLSPDSASYIGAARNLLGGHGLSISTAAGEFAPVTQYPPLFSALLAVAGFFGVDPIRGVRWLHAVLFGANLFLVGRLVRSYGCSARASLFASFLMMTSVISLQVHSMAWSEPLFVLLLFLFFLLLAEYLENQRVSYLIYAALICALSALTRYAGVAVIATGVLAVFLWGQGMRGARAKRAILFFLIGTGPLVLWLVRNVAVAETVVAREIGFHPITQGHLEAALDSVTAWLLPGAVLPASRYGLLALTVLLALIFFLARREKGQPCERTNEDGLKKLCPLLLVFVGMYGLMLVVSISFFDAYMSIDNRYLYPVYVSTIALALCFASHFFRVLGKTPLVRACFVALGLFFCGIYLVQGISWLRFSYYNGIGFSSRSWKDSGLIAQVKALDPHVPLFTNAPDAVYLLTQRRASILPRKLDLSTGKPNRDYAQQLAATGKQLGSENGILVYFRSVTWRWYLPSEDELKETLGLSMIAREEDGAVYQLGKGRE